MATGLVFDERFLKHDTGEAGLFITAGENFIEPEEYVENPRRIGRAKNLLDRSGLTASLVNLPARRASEEEIGLYHTVEQIEAIRMLCAWGGDTGLYTSVEDPYLPSLDQVPIQKLTRGQEEAIERTRQALAAYWQF